MSVHALPAQVRIVKLEPQRRQDIVAQLVRQRADADAVDPAAVERDLDVRRHHVVHGADRPRRADERVELYFVPFVSEAFTKVRTDLVPAQPEHGGIGVYDPSTLIPALIVGSTGPDPDGWWPLAFDETRDCEAPVVNR